MSYLKLKESGRFTLLLFLKKEIIMQLIKNNKREILLSCVVSLIGIYVLLIAEYTISKNTAISFPIEIWIDGSKILDFFFPLIITLPFSWMLYYERKDGFINYASMRKERKKYLFGRIMSGMISAFAVTFIIYYVGLVVAVLFLQPETLVNDNILYRYLWGHFQANNPLIFGIFWCAWKGLIGSIICAFGYLVALVVDNIFVVALLPFIYCTVENFITGTLHLEKYSVTTTYILNRLSPTKMSVVNYFAGLITFVLIGTILIIGINYRNKRKDKEEREL